MLNLYITRHGETEWNIEKRIQGWSDSELTEKGIKYAISLGNRLENVNFDEIHSSPSKRTIITAEFIRGEQSIPIVEQNDLREINMGTWEGKTLTFIKDTYPDEHDAFWNTPHLFKPIGGESFLDVHSRCTSILQKIIHENINKGNVLIVTHSVVIKMILAYIKRLPISQMWEPPFIHDTSLTIVQVNHDGEMKIIIEGDNSHTLRSNEKPELND